MKLHKYPPINNTPVAIGLFLALLFVLAVVYWRNGDLPAITARSNSQYSSEPVPLHDESTIAKTGSSTGHEESIGDAISALPTGQEFEIVMRGDIAIDEFILRHLALAEAGNADSAHYVSEAMLYCAQEQISFSLSFDQFRTQTDGINNSTAEISELILDGLIGKPEFYRVEARRHLDRAIACQRLGWDSQYLYEQAVRWDETAAALGQDIALAKAASIDMANLPVDSVRIEKSKAVMRELLRESREIRVFLYASSVVSASTGNDYAFERLAWALATCEFQPCDSMNYIYRGACEVMTLQGSDICTEDMTDIDYLFRKYPNQFDAALARASEIERALSSQDWQSLGLD